MTDLNKALGDPAKVDGLDFGKAIDAAEKRQTEEETAFIRAVNAGKLKKSLNLREQQILDTFEEKDRGAVLAFVRWCEGQKFIGGPRVKLAAKAAFVQGFRIAEAIYGPTEEQQEAKSKLLLP